MESRRVGLGSDDLREKEGNVSEVGGWHGGTSALNLQGGKALQGNNSGTRIAAEERISDYKLVTPVNDLRLRRVPARCFKGAVDSLLT